MLTIPILTTAFIRFLERGFIFYFLFFFILRVDQKNGVFYFAF